MALRARVDRFGPGVLPSASAKIRPLGLAADYGSRRDGPAIVVAAPRGTSGVMIMDGLRSSVRLLFQAAMAIFVVTIVIGILNGAGLWSPSHNLLLTHVHAGTLGWITLAVIATALRMFADGADEAAVTGARRMAGFAVLATVLYVIAFAATSGILRPITGTLMLVAIVWALVWTAGRYGSSVKSSAQLGLLLAMISLTIGGVLGVLLGLFIARGSLPGMSTDTAMALAGAHPPAMLIGYLILAGAAIAHWLLDGKQTKPGRTVMWLLFLAGIIANLAFILDIEPLIPVFTLLQVVSIIVLVVHLRSSLATSAWSGANAGNYARVGLLFLVVGVALMVYVVQLLTSGQLNPETGEGQIGVLLAFDHAMFIGVMTNVLFALLARTAGVGANPVTLWGVNAALVVFLAGLVADVAVLVQIGAPVMGLLLLHALAVLFMRLRDAPASTTA
jgi:hypothetical protein